MTPPPSRPITAFVAALALAAALVAIAAGAPKPQPLQRGIGVFRLGDTFRRGSGYGRYDFLVVGYGDIDAAARTSRRALVYKAGTEVQPGESSDRGAANTGVPYAEAAARGWLLKDAAGKELQPAGNDWLGDVGSQGYQQAWLSN